MDLCSVIRLSMNCLEFYQYHIKCDTHRPPPFIGIGMSGIVHRITPESHLMPADRHKWEPAAR